MNILIVDDQKEVVWGLLKGVNWKDLFIEQAYGAYSAEEARRIFREHTIDIMLCDIEMPRENGLSLFRWVVQEYTQTECIFLTSHAEFRYAQEAISLGSFDYILQPAPYEEIEAVVRKARLKVLQRKTVQKMEKVQSYKEEFLDSMADTYLRDMVNYRSNAGQNMEKILLLTLKNKYSNLRIYLALLQIVAWRKGHREWEGSLLRRSITNMIQEIFSPQHLEVMLLKYDKEHYVLAICAEEGALDPERCHEGLTGYHQFEEAYMDFTSALYIAGVVEPEEVGEKLKDLLEYSRQNIMRQGKIFSPIGKQESDFKDKIKLFHVECWDQLLEKGKGEQIREEITNYFENPRNQLHNNFEVLKELHCCFTKALFSVLQKKNINYNQVFGGEFSLDRYMTAYDSYENFMKAVDFILALQEGGKDQSPLEEDQIRKAMHFIQNNLDKKITREDLAEYIHLNEDYLSRLFKKKTGYMVKEYIMMEKIKLAKELLKSTNMSVSLIALKTGFNNFSHFSQAFKKLENISPNDYRSQFQTLYKKSE